MSYKNTAQRKQGFVERNGMLLGIGMQATAILWFIALWFVYRTGFVNFTDTRLELLMPIYVLYLLGVGIITIARIVGLQQVPQKKRPHDVMMIFIYPAFSLIALILFIDWVKFGFVLNN